MIIESGEFIVIVAAVYQLQLAFKLLQVSKVPHTDSAIHDGRLT